MKDFKIGLQLYSVRDHMEKNVEETLKKVAEIGYKYVEFAGFYDYEADEMKKMLDKYGLNAISVHQVYTGILEKPEYMVNYFKTLGIKYCAMPWMPRDSQKGTPKFDGIIEDFKKVGKLLKDNGIQFLYHNHDFEFDKFEGKFLLDWLYESVPADILQTEIDTCWVRYAGYDPCEYMKKYEGRTTLLHLKDFYTTKFNAGSAYDLIGDDGKEPEKKEKNVFEFRPLGKGMNDFPEIIKTAEDIGVECLIVEQDES